MKNAVKFTPSPGRIDIRTCNPRPGMLRIEVSDTGMGIDPAYLDRIFDAFEQGGRSITRSFGGMGLGLAICKRLVHLHDGTIQAASPGCGQGSTFTVELATLPQRTEQRASLPEQTAGTAMPSDAPASRLRVLLVEDHADTAHIVQQVLCALGHDVRAAGDAASALALMARERFQLLISDLGLPDGSGLDLMRKLRTADGAIRGIALSGYGTEEDIRRSREAGFGVHLTKPISAASLAESVSAATGSTDRAATDAPGMQT
jgi:CheY-like chemotaxis protein